MALRYILDGYNLIKSGPSRIFEGMSLQDQRAHLVELIIQNRPQGSARNGMTIVFDGRGAGPYESAGFSREHAGDIEIYYSEGQSADALIENLVMTSPRPAECVVVTDDKGIRRLIGASGARCESIRDFAARLAGRGRCSESDHDQPDQADEPPGGWPWK